MAFIDRDRMSNLIMQYSLMYFVNGEFKGNLKPGAKFNRRQAEQLADLYPDIYDEYLRRELIGE